MLWDIRIWTCLLYGVGVASCTHNVTYEYRLINKLMTWHQARQYCRQRYTDLATFKSLEDINRVHRPRWYHGIAWIGLFDDTASWRGVMGNSSNSWRWSATGTTSPGGFQKWASGQPDYYAGKHECMTIAKWQWFDSPCSARCPFACFSGSPEPGKKNYTLVNVLMTKAQAQSHCRQHYTDLAMIENKAENSAVASLYPSVHVWTGLYREPWRWSDGSQKDFTYWLKGHPNNYKRREHCVIEHINRFWNDVNCAQRRQFICQGFASRKSNLWMKFQADVGLSETAVYTQIIQQIEVELASIGVTDVVLKWRSPPVLQRNLLSTEWNNAKELVIDEIFTNDNTTYNRK